MPTERRPPRGRALASALLVLLTWGASVPAEPACTCVANRERMGWCEVHTVGWVAGIEVRSAPLFEALDAHGHAIEDRFLECETCRRAKAAGGFCDEHDLGFVDGLAYLTRLTYHMARGRLLDADALECPVCRKNAETHGYCAKCGRGLFARVEVEGKAAFQEADRAYHVLLEALQTVERCETCAAAMVVDGRCPHCRISYRDGKALPP